jgi:hypothetical protein
MVDSNWKFSALSISEANGWDIGSSGSFTGARNTTVTFADGSDVYIGANLQIFGANMNVIVSNGSTLRCKDGSGIRNGTAGGGLRVDGSTVVGNVFYTDVTWGNSTTNQWLEFAGSGASIGPLVSFRNANEDPNKPGANLQNADSFFRFSVPMEEWKTAPIYSETEDEMFGGMVGTANGGYVISVDADSPFFMTGWNRTVPLVVWKGGIATAHVTLAEPPEGAEVFFTYGWPSVSKTPSPIGEAPTGISATLHGRGTTIFIVR